MLIFLNVDWKCEFMRNGSKSCLLVLSWYLKLFKVLLISISMVNDVCVFLGHNKCLYVKISDYLVIFHSNSKITRRSAPDTEWAAPSAIHKKSHESILVPAPITISIQSIVLTVDFGDRWLLTFYWLMHPEPISLQFFAWISIPGLFFWDYAWITLLCIIWQYFSIFKVTYMIN
jgi:hypothetical protein